ncbi:head maturation protease, ClpP-related [Ancrocorticia populi]|uniref:head maturation protease, ClpP-related n=1 Tax=Ancrocorticia populi TaxID=2175228 RepID=UPI003F9E3C2E
MNKPHMQVLNQSSSPEFGAEVLIYGIVGDWWEDMDAATFAHQIDALDTDSILVRTHSLGGDVWDGIAIMNSLSRHKAKVTVLVEGIAASAASFIAVGGSDELVMAPHSQLMIHDAWTFAAGNAAEITKLAGNLDRESQNVAEIYAAKSGTPVEEWREAMQEETWFTAREAVACGLADRVGMEQEVEAKEPRIEDFAGSRVMAALRYRGRDRAPRPSITNHKEDADMALKNTLAAKLGVKDSLDQGAVLAALDEALKSSGKAVSNSEEASNAIKDEVPTLSDGEWTELVELAELTEDATVREVIDALADKITAPDEGGTSDELTTRVDSETLAELRDLAAYGISAKARDERSDRVSKVDQAIKENRISAKSRDRWVKAVIDSPESALAELKAIPVDTIPRVELGHGQSLSEESQNETYNAALAAAFNS